MKGIMISLMFSLFLGYGYAQDLQWEGKTFTINKVKAAVVDFQGERVLKIERDLKALPFNAETPGLTVDEPTYVKLKNVDFTDGVIEVKVLSTIQQPSPFAAARGFIGLAFRINENDSAYESVYLRPQLGRSTDQLARNHSVQYYSYPDFKFDRLRKEAPGRYETYADIGLNEWITLRLEVKGRQAALFINGQKNSSFVVADMLGTTTNGQIALWVDIATTGYFKDLKISKE